MESEREWAENLSLRERVSGRDLFVSGVPHFVRSLRILICLDRVSNISWQIFNKKEVHQHSQLLSSSGKMKWLQVQRLKFCNGAVRDVSSIHLGKIG